MTSIVVELSSVAKMGQPFEKSNIVSKLLVKFVRPHNNPVTTFAPRPFQLDCQYLHFQFYVLCFGKHHRFVFASCLFIDAGHVTCMLAAPLILHRASTHTRRTNAFLAGGWLRGWVVDAQTATFNHKLDFYFNLNEIINFGIRFN